MAILALIGATRTTTQAPAPEPAAQLEHETYALTVRFPCGPPDKRVAGTPGTSRTR
ncbi:hypothetical protein [Arthrobacter oryzae]|uniref:hypothetical protein n=1 Tax=Arthrobacter oryzae TaxID=409290 RepID=UPI002858F856|nr:hypothetical protein [Arthrobacter oryzae]MDR6508380.1 hypothetical protein [Arthrobacter oryzae]